MAKWACELGAFDIEFRARTAIKSQALADFVAEWTEQQVPPNLEKLEHWKIYFDGSLKLVGAGAGILFISPTGQQLKCNTRFIKGHKPSNHIRAMIKSHVYKTE